MACLVDPGLSFWIHIEDIKKIHRRYQFFLSGGAPYNLCSLLSTFAHFCPLTSFLSVSLPSDSTDMSDATEEALGIPILLPSEPLPSEMLDLQ